MDAYRDLLQALNRHGWQLFGSDRPATGARGSTSPDVRAAAAVTLVDELASVGRRIQEETGSSRSRVATGWRSAAISIRTSSDLLATHRDRDGAWRSPHACLLDDPNVRAVGFAELAGLVVPLADAAAALELRLGQAGVTWRNVTHSVPDTSRLLDAAVRVRRLGSANADGNPLHSLEVARPGVCSGDPVVELRDRLARLHALRGNLPARRTWALPHSQT